jgi:hypothetical protein
VAPEPVWRLSGIESLSSSSQPVATDWLTISVIIIIINVVVVIVISIVVMVVIVKRYYEVFLELQLNQGLCFLH